MKLFQILRRLCADCRAGNFLKLLLDDGFTFFLCLLAGVVLEVFLQRHKRIGQAAVLDLPALAERHEAVTGAPCAIAGGAEARHITEVEQPLYDFVQGPSIIYIKLGVVILRAFLFLLTAHAGAGCAGNL